LKFSINTTVIGLFSEVSILLQMIKQKLESVLWYPIRMIKNEKNQLQKSFRAQYPGQNRSSI
jgi:hypothetical protein